MSDPLGLTIRQFEKTDDSPTPVASMSELLSEFKAARSEQFEPAAIPRKVTPVPRGDGENPLWNCVKHAIFDDRWKEYHYYTDPSINGGYWIHEDMFATLFDLKSNSEYLKRGASVCEPFSEGKASQAYYFVSGREIVEFGMGDVFSMIEGRGLEIPDSSVVGKLSPIYLRIISQYMRRSIMLIDKELTTRGKSL